MSAEELKSKELQTIAIVLVMQGLAIAGLAGSIWKLSK